MYKVKELQFIWLPQISSPFWICLCNFSEASFLPYIVIAPNNITEEPMYNHI